MIMAETKMVVLSLCIASCFSLSLFRAASSCSCNAMQVSWRRKKDTRARRGKTSRHNEGFLKYSREVTSPSGFFTCSWLYHFPMRLLDCYEKKDHVFGHINMQWNAFLPVCSYLESLYYQTKYHIPSHLNKWILNVQFKYKLRASMKVWHPFCFFSSRWVSNLQMSFHNKYIYILKGDWRD